jgi:hypothetical protein
MHHMSHDLVNRIRAARPTVLALSRADTFLLKAYLDRYPAPQRWYECDYDAQRRIGSVGEYTDPDDEALWIHLRATLEYSQAELDRLASAEPQPVPAVTPTTVPPPGPNTTPGTEQDVMQWMAASDDTALKVVAIAQMKDRTVDERMRLIGALDSRFMGKDSNDLASLLNVTSAAIRQTACWKDWQKLKKSPD